MNTIGNIIESAINTLDSIILTGSDLATIVGALGLGGTTSSTLDDGLEDGSAIGLGLSTATSSIAAYENNPNIFNIQDAISYVESLSDEELAHADQMLTEKGIGFEIVEESNFEDTPKTFIKNI